MWEYVIKEKNDIILAKNYGVGIFKEVTMSFIPTETSIGRVLSNNIQYLIPRYQRKYVWKEEQWKNLIEDIILSMNLIDKNNYHFLGSFIFEKKTSGWIIIDGQQRLTSLTLLISVISKKFLFLSEDKLYEGIRKYCVYKDDSGNDKIRLVSDDVSTFSNIVFDYFEQEHICNSIDEYFEQEKIDVSKSNCIFVECFNYFEKYIDNVLISMDAVEQVNWLIKLRDAIINLKAIEIVVDKEQEGHIIFEILNSRGVPLEQNELLKNYIFMYYPNSVGSDIAKDKWNKIISNIEGQSISSLKRFISHYITHVFGKVSQKQEYRTIRDNVDKKSVKPFLDDLVFKSEMYKDFNNPYGSNYSPTIKYVLQFLLNNNNYQFRPILLSFFEAYNQSKLSEEKLEKYMVSIKNFLSIYVLICKEKTNTLESIIYEYASELHKHFTNSLAKEFIAKLFEKVSREKFSTSFSQLTFSNRQTQHNLIRNARKEARYILFEYEIYLSRIDDYTLTKFTIEHILADSQPENFVCYIGNLIPLVKALNKKIKDAVVEDKLIYYGKSAFSSTSEFLTMYDRNKEWGEKEILHRTNQLANCFFDNIWNKKI